MNSNPFMDRLQQLRRLLPTTDIEASAQEYDVTQYRILDQQIKDLEQQYQGYHDHQQLLDAWIKHLQQDVERLHALHAEGETKLEIFARSKLPIIEQQVASLGNNKH